MTNQNLGQWVYELVMGELDLDRCPVPGAYLVANAFEEGSECSAAYEQMLDAYGRICNRLGLEQREDSDVEIILHSLSFIQRHIALKMFEYGSRIGQ